MNTPLAASRLRAQLNGFEHAVGTNGWVVNRLLANRKIDKQEILTHAQNLNAGHILLDWAIQAPDWPLSTRQMDTIKTLLFRFREDAINIGPMVLELAQSDKYSALLSFLSGLDSPKATQEAGYQLLFSDNFSLPPQADKVVLFTTKHLANHLANFLDKMISTDPSVATTLQYAVSSTVWRFGKLGEHFQVLEGCINHLELAVLEDECLHSRLVKINQWCEPLINASDLATQLKVTSATAWLSPTLRRHALGKVALNTNEGADSTSTPKPHM